MKANSGQIRGALDTPRDARLFVLHGPDESGAAELAQRLARAMGPEAERIDFDGAALRANPGRLADEAASLSLFGGARHIRVSGAGEECFDAFTLLLAAERVGNPVVALAPTLKATGKVLKLVTAAPHAWAYACYPPTDAEAGQIAVAIAREHGLRVHGDTAHHLVTASGGDRAVLAREIEKLALYLDAAPDRPRDLDEAAIEAVGADVGDSAISRLVDAVIDGRTAAVGGELARLDEAGVSAIPLLRQLARRLIALAGMRAEVDAGNAAAEVVERHRVFFREKPATIRALRRWDSPRLGEALARTRRAERAVMAPGNAGAILAAAEFVAIARVAARLG